MKKNLFTIILVLIFLIGLSVLLYPAISNYFTRRSQVKMIARYNETVSGITQEDYDAIFASAEDYNKRLRETSGSFYEPEKVTGYRTELDITGTGIMGYIAIPRIQVELPIYHGTSEETLNSAAGHLEGTSLPVGGVGTHCVLSAHRGLPSAKLFTNLDKLEKGDIFTITVLNRLLTYEVDQIRVTEPEDVRELQIQEGEDYCTLVTCTPYGINTHRLLVRGRRIDNELSREPVSIVSDSEQVTPVIVVSVLAALILLALLITFIVLSRKKKGKSIIEGVKKNED